MIIGDSCFQAATTLKLNGLSKLKTLEIGSNSFSKLNELRLEGLSELESVVIRDNSFTQHSNGYGNNPTRRFYLKNCPKLKTLEIGKHSFSDYTTCETETVPSIQTLVVGENCFRNAAFSLRSGHAVNS